MATPGAIGAPGAVGGRDRARPAAADRHVDPAILVRSTVADLGPEAARRLVDANGVGVPDTTRPECYRIADDLW